LDGQKSGAAGSLSGNEWYNLEAFRAINQAVGRVIRHKDDFGAVLLLDRRFASNDYRTKLSSWLPPVKNFKDFKRSIGDLETFFSQHQYFPKPKAILSRAPLEKKRPLISSNATSSSAVLKAGPAPKRQKIVIKSRGAATREAEDSQEENDSSKSKRDIQHFVLGLKERLEKKELKEVILAVKAYKESGQIQGLTGKLQALRGKLRVEDISEFRTFLRGEDDKRIFDAIFA
jgi:hypothetical protein